MAGHEIKEPRLTDIYTANGELKPEFFELIAGENGEFIACAKRLMHSTEYEFGIILDGESRKIVWLGIVYLDSVTPQEQWKLKPFGDGTSLPYFASEYYFAIYKLNFRDLLKRLGML